MGTVYFWNFRVLMIRTHQMAVYILLRRLFCFFWLDWETYSLSHAHTPLFSLLPPKFLCILRFQISPLQCYFLQTVICLWSVCFSFSNPPLYFVEKVSPNEKIETTLLWAFSFLNFPRKSKRLSGNTVKDHNINVAKFIFITKPQFIRNQTTKTHHFSS